MKNSAESRAWLGDRAGHSWLGRCAALLVFGVMPGLATALTAGQIVVQSHLNEPFRATVPLRALQVGEVEELKVGLASDDAYRSLGLEKSQFLSSLQFDVREGSSADQASLIITTSETAKEPFFSVLLSFRGLSGTLVREYTVLLDPNTGTPRRESAPVVAIEDQAPTTTVMPAPAVSKPAPAPRQTASMPAQASTQPVVRTPERSAPAQPFRGGDRERKVPVPTPAVLEGAESASAAEDSSGPAPVVLQNEPVSYGSEFGPVRAGMTLWQIAAAVRPDPSVTMNQVMWGLYSNNPEQFDGNLNLVKRGAVLNVPSIQALRDVSPAEANALVADEAQRHRDGLKSSAAATASSEPQKVDLEPAAPKPVATAPVTKAESSVPAAKATAAPKVPEPAQEPLELVEDKPATQQEPSSVLPAAPAPDSGDAGDYEQLEALPAADAEDAEYAELPTLPMDDGEDELMAEDDMSEAELASDSGSESASPGDSGDEYPNLFGVGLAALGVLILGLLVVLGLRRRNKDNDQGPVSDFTASRPPQRKPVSDFADSAAAPTAAVASQTDDDFADTMAFDATATSDLDDTLTQDTGDDTHDFDIPDLDDFVSGNEPKAPSEDFGDTVQFDEPQTPPVDFGDTEVSAAAPAAGSETVAEEMDFSDLEMDSGTQTLDLGSETVSLELNEDPLSEADFQLAYGLYDEAALLLNRAIEAEPDRLELHEKLAETHFAASDPEKFKQAAESLKARGPDAETWQRIAIMGQQLCPGDALFSDLDDASGASVDLDMDFDGDTAEAPSDAASNTVEFSLDDAPAAEPEIPAAAAPEDDNVLEFNLDDDSATGEAESATATSSLDDDFEADFGDFGTDEAASDDLPDLEDLNLDDLAAELDDGAALETPASDDADKTTVDAPDDFADLTLSDVSDTELELDTDEPALVDDGDFSLSDIDVSDDASVTADADDLSLTAQEPVSPASDDDFSLSLDDDGEVSDDSLSLDDLDLSDGSDGQDTEFSLDDLSLDDAGDDNTDLSEFTLDDDSDLTADLSGEETDFNLDDLGDAEEVAGGDESATKLDLARAYADMGESDMARGLLEEVAAAGSDEQKAEAQELLSKL